VDPLDRLRSALADHYALQREIGRGGMAIVFLARDLRHSRDVAIKVLKPEFAMAVSADRFLREIQLEARLKHPHILPLFDSGEVDGLPYYVMPYVSGESLRARLERETQLSLDDAIRITGEVAEALAYASAQGIVHRDVKPGNILLDGNHAFLADFGIARAVSELAGDRLSESGIVVGTPEYMSPEQCTEHGNVDGRSDVYALGCVVYEMLAGEPPFTGPTAQAIVARHLSEEPRSLRVVRTAVPEHVEEAIRVALAKVPADRFSTALEFIKALRQAGSIPVSIRPKHRTHRLKIRNVAGLTLCVLGVVGFGIWRFSGGPPRVGDPADPAAGTVPLSSIAVMYLQDRSEKRNLDYLTAGLTEDLIDQLAAVRSLRVISPDGVKPFRGRDVPLDTLERVLRIGTLVTGTLTEARGRLRAAVRVTDVASSTQLFSGTFDEPLRDVLALRDRMAEEITRQLRRRLGEAVQLRERRAGTTNGAAWDLLHQAEQLRSRASDLPGSESPLSRRMLHQADSLLIRAGRLDPAWQEPRVLRGWIAYDQADRAADVTDTTRSAIESIESWIRSGVGHADSVLAKGPNDPEALELRGTLLYRSWALTSLYGIRDTIDKLGRAEQDLRRAAANPYRHQARALSTLSAVLEFAGKVAEANLAAEQSYEADAYLQDADAIMFRVFNTSLDLKRFADAQSWCERGRRTFPKDWTFLLCQLSLLGWSKLSVPDVDAAWRVVRQLDSVASPEAAEWMRPEMTMMVAAVIARAGLPDSAERVIGRSKADAPPDPQLPYYEALARIRLNQPQVAADLLKDLLARTPNFLRFFRSRSAFTPLWNDPRYGLPRLQP
jgi:eukaryotic-like serine/threonine-protein kinase